MKASGDYQNVLPTLIFLRNLESLPRETMGKNNERKEWPREMNESFTIQKFPAQKMPNFILFLPCRRFSLNYRKKALQ